MRSGFRGITALDREGKVTVIRPGDYDGTGACAGRRAMMNRDQNVARTEIDEFFKKHPDAAAFFIAAGLELEYVRMAILGVLTEDVQPGNKQGYAMIVKRVVAQRERDRLGFATGEHTAQDPGGVASASSDDLPPPVMTLRQLDPKTSGIPWWSGRQILVRLVDLDKMLARIDEVQRLPADQGGGAGGGLLKMLPTIGRHRELRRVTVRQLEKVNALRLKFPHCSAVIDRVQSALHARAVAGSWAQIPPILLKGGPGTGKTTFSRALAACLGVDFFQIAASHDILKLTGLGPPWRGATVGAIAKALGKSPYKDDEPGCANPVMLIDELDKAGGQIRSADSGSSWRFLRSAAVHRAAKCQFDRRVCGRHGPDLRAVCDLDFYRQRRRKNP